MKITLDERKVRHVSQHSEELFAVSTVAFLYASDFPIRLHLVDSDGEVKPLGQLPPGIDHHTLELRGYYAIGWKIEPEGDGEFDPDAEVPLFALQVDVRHQMGELLDPTPLTKSVGKKATLTEAERTRRIVMQTLMTTKTSPTEEEMEALETELRFSFDDEEFGLYIEPDQEAAEEDDEADEDPPAPKKAKPPSKAAPKAGADAQEDPADDDDE